MVELNCSSVRTDQTMPLVSAAYAADRALYPAGEGTGPPCSPGASSVTRNRRNMRVVGQTKRLLEPVKLTKGRLGFLKTERRKG